MVAFHNMPDPVQTNAVGCVLQTGSLGLCKEAQPLFNATSAQQSNFSGHCATCATVINKRVADGCNFTDILQSVSYSVPHYSIITSWKQRREEKEETREHKVKTKVKPILREIILTPQTSVRGYENILLTLQHTGCYTNSSNKLGDNILTKPYRECFIYNCL